MKASVAHEVFVEALQEASRFTASKGFASPLLSGIYLEVTESNRLIIRSSTGSVIFQAEIPCQTEEPGASVIPAGLLLSSMKTLEKGAVQIEGNIDQVTFSHGSSRFHISALSGEVFPTFSPDDYQDSLLFPVKGFSEAARKVLIAASADETKPVLTSVLLEMSQPNTLVATDGFRLYQSMSDLSLNSEGKILFPAKILRELLGILEKRDLEVLECLTDDQRQSLLFRLGNESWLKMSAIAGDYPPYRSIIPEACSFSFGVEREPLQQAVKQAMIFAKEYSGIVVFTLEKSELLISSQTSASGRTKSRLPLIRQDGEVERFAVNGKYLLDFLNSLDSLEVQIQGTSPLKPVIFRVPEDESLLYLIMPFKLQE